MYIEVQRSNGRTAMYNMRDVIVTLGEDGIERAYDKLDTNDYLGVVLNRWTIA